MRGKQNKNTQKQIESLAKELANIFVEQILLKRSPYKKQPKKENDKKYVR